MSGSAGARRWCAPPPLPLPGPPPTPLPAYTLSPPESSPVSVSWSESGPLTRVRGLVSPSSTPTAASTTAWVPIA